MTTAIPHLEGLRNDARDEIKRRIEQRDKYSIQLTISLGAIVAFALSGTGFREAITAAPLVSIYFTVLILYSYRIHKILARYLREHLEPSLAELCGTNVALEWETYYRANAVPGIRRSFFMAALLIVCVLTAVYAWLENFSSALRVASLIYIAVAFLIACIFWKD